MPRLWRTMPQIRTQAHIIHPMVVMRVAGLPRMSVGAKDMPENIP